MNLKILMLVNGLLFFMKSESLFIKCPSCGQLSAKKNAKCSSCGYSLFFRTKKKYVVGGALILILLAFTSIDRETKQPTTTSHEAHEKQEVTKKAIQEIASDEKRFIDIVEEIQQKHSSSKNELQKSMARDERKKLLSNINIYEVNNWVGTITKLDTNNDGKGILVVKIAPALSVGTWNNAFSDIQNNTLIEKNTKLYNSLLDMKVGQKIRFSGQFFPSDDDAIKEKSMTIDGSLSEPEFLFKFYSVSSI